MYLQHEYLGKDGTDCLSGSALFCQVVTRLGNGHTVRCEPNVVILQLDRDCPCRYTHAHTHTHQTHAAAAGSSLLPPGRPSIQPSSCKPNPTWFVRPEHGRRSSLVSCRMQNAQRRVLELLPLGKREDQTLEPPGSAGCHTTLQPGMMARVCLPRVINTRTAATPGRQSDRFVESCPDRGWCVCVGGRMGGFGLDT